MIGFPLRGTIGFYSRVPFKGIWVVLGLGVRGDGFRVLGLRFGG